MDLKSRDGVCFAVLVGSGDAQSSVRLHLRCNSGRAHVAGTNRNPAPLLAGACARGLVCAGMTA